MLSKPKLYIISGIAIIAFAVIAVLGIRQIVISDMQAEQAKSMAERVAASGNALRDGLERSDTEQQEANNGDRSHFQRDW